MKRILASFILAVTLTSHAQAVDYTITLTPEQDIVLQWAAARPDPPQQPSAVRPRAHLQAIVDEALRSAALNRADFKGKKMLDYFWDLTPAEQLQTCTSLKLSTEYCTAP